MWTKRHLLKLLWGLAAWSALSAVPTRPRASPVLFPEAASEIEKGICLLFKNDESFRKVGHNYLMKNPKDANLNFLRMKLLSDAEKYLVDFSMNCLESNMRLTGFLQRKIRNDFETHNTICIDGWIMSETEIHLAAYLSLVNKTDFIGVFYKK